MPNIDEQAFLRMVRENEARLRNICRVYSRDAESRRDLYQEILVQLWRAFPTFRREASVSTWLYRVALNTAVSHLRRQGTGALRETPLLEEHDRPVEESGAGTWMDERLDREQQVARLHAAIARLGVADRMLATMYLDERTYREMADVLGGGINENAVGVRLNRIRKQLAAALAEPVVPRAGGTVRQEESL